MPFSGQQIKCLANLYTALTTICAFLSLIFSEIKPIIDLLMMTVGLLVSITVTFTLLPAL